MEGTCSLVLRVIDWLGDQVARCCTPKMQRRIGVVMCLLSLPLFVGGFFVNEPFLVYQMSAGALLFGGLSTVVAAVPSEECPPRPKKRQLAAEPSPVRAHRRRQSTSNLRRDRGRRSI